MNICFVYDCEYPWDIRVEKICNSLIKVGNNVSLICRNKNGKPVYSELEKMKIYRLPYVGENILTSCLNATFFFNPLWILKIYLVVSKMDCHLILVRDLPLSLAGVLVGKLKRIPVVVDMAEPYPLTVRQRRKFEPFKMYHYITRNFFFADILEKIATKTAAHIFTVCEEAKYRLLGKGIDPRRITIIRNTPELKKFHPIVPSYPGVLKKLKGKFIILYVGIIIGGRGIDVAIKAMKEVSKKNKDIKLVVVGNGKLEVEMRKLASQLHLQETVYFEGWVNNDKVVEYLNSCDLGLLPFMNTQHINHTLANKVFDFMAVGKPMLCSDVKPMRRIIKGTGVGYLFEAGNYASLRDKILQIVEDDDLKDKGKRSIEFAQERYNWENEARKIERIFTALTKQ